MNKDIDSGFDSPDEPTTRGIEMARKHHKLKIETQYFQAIESGLKKFELRKNDRDFQPYDMVYLEEVVNGIHTGRTIHPPLEINYVFNGGEYGLDGDYCIFNWK